MGQLRVLLVQSDPTEAERISALLEKADHFVLPIEGLQEASEALEIQRFDAVLLPSGVPDEELTPFKARLRELEANQRLAVRIPILACSGQKNGSNGIGSAIDGYLPHAFEPLAFANAVTSLAGTVSQSAPSGAVSGREEYPIFDPEGFLENVAEDRELAVEVIDLFLEEYVQQVKDMEAALEGFALPTLSALAHTIKGSLASLRATRARYRAQALELAAKNGDREACAKHLAELKQDLKVLRPELLRLIHPS